MSLFRNILIVGIVGLVFGAGIGVGYVIWQRQQTAPPLPHLSASCSGGNTPVVLVTWPAELDPVIAGLQRSVAQGPWTDIAGGESVKSGQGHFVDLAVQPETQYEYRVAQNGSPISDIAHITTTAAACR